MCSLLLEIKEGGAETCAYIGESDNDVLLHIQLLYMFMPAANHDIDAFIP